jgi:hypothetical protein
MARVYRATRTPRPQGEAWEFAVDSIERLLEYGRPPWVAGRFVEEG